MSEYLHGYTSKEQDRLLEQAEFLEPYVYSGVGLEFVPSCLEIGSGVGAQTKILCRRFPKLKIECVELSPVQIERAQRHLKSEIKSGQVLIHKNNALSFNLKKKFDSAFICWLLEHVQDPVAVLKNARKHLKSGSLIYLSEVFNQTLFMDPYSPSYLKYWFEFNDLQWSIQGHPFIGAKLGHLLKAAGFTDIKTEIRPFHFDSRDPQKRASFMEYFFQILLSAEKELLRTGRVSKQLVKDMRREVELAKKTEDSVFFYAYVHAQARCP